MRAPPLNTVSANDGPNDHTALDALNREPSEVAATPSEPVSVRSGYHAACATPIWAFADATADSAAAISGRRCSKVEVTSAGTTGTSSLNAAVAMETSTGVW